jgi:hypothetical protein
MPRPPFDLVCIGVFGFDYFPRKHRPRIFLAFYWRRIWLNHREANHERSCIMNLHNWFSFLFYGLDPNGRIFISSLISCFFLLHIQQFFDNITHRIAITRSLNRPFFYTRLLEFCAFTIRG